MLLLSHTGITLGIFSLLEKAFLGISLHRKKERDFVSITESSFHPIYSDPPEESKKCHIDYRFILFGSMLPDIVDKPLGMLIFAGLIANGRIYTHTLLVNLILVFIGIYFWRRKSSSFLPFSLASCFHLVLDEMWLNLQTLLWPLYGWSFPKQDISHWWENIFQGLFTNPWVYVPEIIGAIIILGLGIKLIKKGMMGEFLFGGKLP